MCGMRLFGGVEQEKEESIRLIQHKDFHLAVIGDVGCGKTSLIYRFTRGRLPDETVPTVLDTDEVEIKRKGDKIMLYIHDTSGTEEGARVRNFIYQNSDVIIVCFSIDDPDSLQDVVANWVTELRHLCRQTPFLLVGTKKDCRKERGAKSVKKKEGERTAKMIGAVGYMEYSALDKKRSVKDSKLIFGRAIRECLDRSGDDRTNGDILHRSVF
ncbi:hypothetical protein Btru_001492 [Bulinus truncatus]|nr:hypothetical protein Btru_001492 [Bulinus truncatus]